MAEHEGLKFFFVYGEDTPHTEDGSPFKAYLVVAPNEEEARRLVPAKRFRVDAIEILKKLPGVNVAPGRAGCLGSASPLRPSKMQ
jgi:hypothetical protein